MSNLQCLHSHLSRYNYLVAKKNTNMPETINFALTSYLKKRMYQKGFPKARQTPSFSCEDITNTVRPKIQNNLYCLPPKSTHVYTLFTELFFISSTLCVMYYYFWFKNLLPNHVAFLKVKRYIILQAQKIFPQRYIHENCLGLICCKKYYFLDFQLLS